MSRKFASWSITPSGSSHSTSVEAISSVVRLLPSTSYEPPKLLQPASPVMTPSSTLTVSVVPAIVEETASPSTNDSSTQFVPSSSALAGGCCSSNTSTTLPSASSSSSCPPVMRALSTPCSAPRYA